MKYSVFFTISILLFLTACDSTQDDDAVPAINSYFPPASGDEWQTIDPATLNWDAQKVTELNSFLEQNETRAFIVLVDGKIVIEEYWNTDLLGNAFNKDSYWYWASAGKSLTATLVGIAQQEGHLNINDKTADYLGNGWTNMPRDKEDLITVKNHLTFTTGIDYNVTDLNCNDPSCFNYGTNAGNQWYYHNATYLIVHDILEAATGMTNNQYTDNAIASKIGMSGFWANTAQSSNVYFSDARSAARFGLLTLNQGNWDGTSILNDATYFSAMTTTSQSINESYGYLWWLNGKPSTIFPGFATPFLTSVTPAAPVDMISALGKNGQFIDVIPSLNMVVIRMGNTSNQEPVPILFHDEIWQKLLNAIE
jgi:CubicO group peptidase (beta-lactamase class C family)